jgi:hypothetical protein
MKQEWNKIRKAICVLDKKLLKLDRGPGALTTLSSASLRAPERCAAISLKKARLLHFTRNDNFLNRDLGVILLLTNNFYYVNKIFKDGEKSGFELEQGVWILLLP